MQTPVCRVVQWFENTFKDRQLLVRRIQQCMHICGPSFLYLKINVFYQHANYFKDRVGWLAPEIC